MFSRKILIRALICSLLALIPFPELENKIYDQKVQLLSHLPQRKQENDVVILEFTKEDFEKLKSIYDPGSDKMQNGIQGTWMEKFAAVRNDFYWNDNVYQGLLAKLLQENPKFLIISFFYPESVVQIQNRQELQKLTRDPRVLWASHFDIDQKFVKPAPELTGTENYGFSNLFPDNDSVVRRSYLISNNHASLPFRALLHDPKSLLQETALIDSFLINYAGRAGTIPTCRILEPCESLKDKYVILAPAGNALARADLFLTPVGVLSRAEILANILDTAKSGTAFYPVHSYLLFIFILVHVLILAGATMALQALAQIRTHFTLLLVEAVIALAAMYVFHLQIPLVPFVIASIVTYFAFLWLELGRQETKRWQAVKRAQYLAELDELKSNFMSLMSHDLKTPIAKVQALTERLAREAQGLSGEHKQILESIQKSNEELAQYIVSILNFQKIESQALILNPKSNDINLLIDEVLMRLEPLANEKKIVIEKELEPLFAIEFDEKLIRQVLNNLIENAIKYNQESTVVTVRSAEEGNFLKITVEDNGSGIPDDQLPRLFKKFSRLEKGTAERVKGTGLGLYLAKYFIELHGGRIEVQSKAGEGTKFYFYLPLSL